MRLLIIILFIITANLNAKAQYVDSVDVPYGTFRITKPGKGKNTESVRNLDSAPTWSNTNDIRCGGVLCSYEDYNALTIGYQFYEFGYTEIGYTYRRTNKFVNDIGIKVGANFASKFYGVNLNVGHVLLTTNRHNHRILSAGFGITGYIGRNKTLFAANPTISFHIPRCVISNFDITYGALLFLDGNPIAIYPQHMATLTYRIPFY